MTPRAWAAFALGGLVIALVVAALLLVPWSRPPAPRADQLAALRDLPADQASPGPGVPRGAAPRRLRRRWPSGSLVALRARADPARARRLVELAGPPVRRPLDRPGGARRAGGGVRRRPAHPALRRLAAVGAHPLRAVHPGLGRLDGATCSSRTRSAR